MILKWWGWFVAWNARDKAADLLRRREEYGGNRSQARSEPSQWRSWWCLAARHCDCHNYRYRYECHCHCHDEERFQRSRWW